MDPRDAQGYPVPDRLAEIFQGRTRLVHWTLRLEALAEELREMAVQRYCRDLRLREVLRHLEAVRALVMLAAPFEPCDCFPGSDCPKCQNFRWVSGLRRTMSGSSAGSRPALLPSTSPK